jgi:hypothetical protein
MSDYIVSSGQTGTSYVLYQGDQQVVLSGGIASSTTGQPITPAAYS